MCKWPVSKIWYCYFCLLSYSRGEWLQELENDPCVSMCDFSLRIKELGPCPWLAMWALTACRISLSTSPSARASASIYSASVPCHALTHINTQYTFNTHTLAEAQIHTGCCYLNKFFTQVVLPAHTHIVLLDQPDSLLLCDITTATSYSLECIVITVAVLDTPNDWVLVWVGADVDKRSKEHLVEKDVVV